jgi:site-specific recombinase XerD
VRQYAEVECKPSTANGYRSVIRSKLIPSFGDLRLDEIIRPEVREHISALIKNGLSRNTIRNTICTLRGIFNQAIEDGLVDRNPAVRLGRFIRSNKPRFEITPLTQKEVERFLNSAIEVCPEYYPLFLTVF